MWNSTVFYSLLISGRQHLHRLQNSEGWQQLRRRNFWKVYNYIEVLIYIYIFWHSFLDIQSKILWVIKICSYTIWWVFFGFCLEHMRKSMINNVGELYITVGINLEFSFQGYGVTFWRMTLWTPYDGWDKRRE